MPNEFFVDALRFSTLTASVSVALLLALLFLFFLSRFVEYVVDIVRESIAETELWRERALKRKMGDVLMKQALASAYIGVNAERVEAKVSFLVPSRESLMETPYPQNSPSAALYAALRNIVRYS